MSYYDDEPENKWDDVWAAIFIGAWIFFLLGIPVLKYFGII